MVILLSLQEAIELLHACKFKLRHAKVRNTFETISLYSARNCQFAFL